MKILIVRHGEPDYLRDSLTEKGWREAEYLAERIAALPVKEFYVSTMGRARDTASVTFKKMGRTGVDCDWLREFECDIRRPDREGTTPIPWDWLPGDWTAEERFYQEKHWQEPEVFRNTRIKEKYDWVTESFDRVLAGHGYERAGRLYRAVRPNNDTIVLFCHLGVQCVLLSHLLGISPMILWHGLCAPPTSVTTVISEERREGVALFRVNGFGDVSHLYVHGEEPSFAARFCECYANEAERRD